MAKQRGAAAGVKAQVEGAQQLARRRWRTCSNRQGAGRGLAATGKAHVGGAVLAARRRWKALSNLHGAGGGRPAGGKEQVEGAWRRQGAGGGALMN
jgi:hypothetical protein